MGQEKCQLTWRARTWCAGDELLLPEDWHRSLGASALSSCGRLKRKKESTVNGEEIE